MTSRTIIIEPPKFDTIGVYVEESADSLRAGCDMRLSTKEARRLRDGLSAALAVQDALDQADDHRRTLDRLNDSALREPATGTLGVPSLLPHAPEATERDEPVSVERLRAVEATLMTCDRALETRLAAVEMRLGAISGSFRSTAEAPCQRRG